MITRFLSVTLFLFLQFSMAYGSESVIESTNCTLVPENLDVVSSGRYFYLGQQGGWTLPQIYRSEQSAEDALRIFEFNQFYKYCTTKDAAGRVVFEYFTTSNNWPPRDPSDAIETCEGFSEAKLAYDFDTRSKKYQVKSAGQVLIDSLDGEAVAKSIFSTMKNLQMNASCKLANSTLFYWKSLFHPLPPVDRDPNKPDFLIESLQWNFDNRGHANHYIIRKEDIRRQFDFGVSFAAQNKSDSPLSVSSTVKINNTVLDQQEFSVDSKQDKPIAFDKKIIISEIATGPRQQVFVELMVKANQKSYKFSKQGEFDFGL